jgi:hypothetical protein
VCLGDGIQLRRRLIQHENSWIRQKRACNCQPLALACGKRMSSFADHRGETARQTRDESAQPGGVHCSCNPGIRGFGLSVANVLQ